MLPSVQGYLLGTREPLDYVGKALDAFQLVSAEMRATRAQNLAEQREGREAGAQAFEQGQSQIQMQDDLMNSALNRELAINDQNLKVADFQLQRDQVQWERDNLAPLAIESKKAQIDSARALADSRRYEMRSQQGLFDQFRSEANDINAALKGVRAGPQAGEEAETFYDRVRNANSVIQKRKAAWADAKSPAVNQFFNAAESELQKHPIYQFLSDRNDLMTAGEQAARRDQRNRAIDLLPFENDTARSRFRSENPSLLESLMKTDDGFFDKWWTQKGAELRDSRKYDTSTSSIAAPRPIGVSAAEGLARLNSAIGKGESQVDLFDDFSKVSIDQAKEILRGMGVPSEMFPYSPRAAGQSAPGRPSPSPDTPPEIDGSQVLSRYYSF